jgi:hypothetical protein
MCLVLCCAVVVFYSPQTSNAANKLTASACPSEPRLTNYSCYSVDVKGSVRGMSFRLKVKLSCML